MTNHNPSSIKPYLIVLTLLACLTSLTVGLSYVKLTHSTAIVLASVIALTKCSLIAAVFMHLRSEKKTIFAILFSALFFVTVLILAIIPDIGIVR